PMGLVGGKKASRSLRRRSPCRRAAEQSAVSERSSPRILSPAPALCRCLLPPAQGARASDRSFRFLTTLAQEMGRSGLAGVSRFLLLHGKQTKACPGIKMARVKSLTAMFLSCRVQKIWCRSSKKIQMVLGSLLTESIKYSTSRVQLTG